MTQAQHDWIERCIAGNEPRNIVLWHEKSTGLIVEVRERRPTRCAALILLSPDGDPIQVDTA
jgi:hypothetical protein